MLASEVTTHIGLIDAIVRIEPGLVKRAIARGQEAVEKSGIAHSRVGVCGIHPHSGENGLFGYGRKKKRSCPPSRRAGAVAGTSKALFRLARSFTSRNAATSTS